MIGSLTNKWRRWRAWCALDDPRGRRPDGPESDLDGALRKQARSEVESQERSLRWSVLAQIEGSEPNSGAVAGEPFRLPWVGIGLAAAAALALSAGAWFALPSAPAPVNDATLADATSGPLNEPAPEQLADSREPSQRELLFDDLRSTFRFVQTGLPIPRLDRFVASSSNGGDAAG